MQRAFLEPRSIPWLIIAAIIAALCVAWLAQYGFGLLPCELCYWQRYAYGGAIVIALGSIITGAKHRRAGLILLTLSLIGVAGIAFFHVGVEYHWWHGTSACGTQDVGSSITDITQAIETAPLTRCDQAAFTLFGLSMAFYNMLYALGLAALAFWGARK